MKKKFAKRFLSWVMAAAMVISMLPLSAMAAEPGDAVAQIGDTPYSTLEAALDAATASEENSVTIKMLDNCTITKSITIPEGKTFTLEAEPDANVTITDNGRYGMRPNGSLTMENITFITNGQIALNGTTSEGPFGREITFRNVTLKMDGENYVFNGLGYYCAAIFADAPANFVFDNCDVEIKDYDVHNGGGAAIRWNGKNGDTGYGVSMINGTTFTSSGCYSGFVGTLDLLVEDSTLDVVDHSGNGSNGTNYTIVNSTVNFSGNGSHGISAGDLIIEENSTVTSENNGFYGVYSSGKFLVDSTSKLIVTKNSAGGDFAGLKLVSSANGYVEAGAVVTITDNYCSGLSNNGKCVFEEGAKLTITGNVNDKGSSSHGGGIYNATSSSSTIPADLTLPSDAVIYNNHALTDGDDIYNNNTATITFGKVGSDWVLDDCEHMIDGWYNDAADARWQAHAENEEDNHIVECNDTTITGLKALKAAHGKNAVDKVSYPGLDKQVMDNDDQSWEKDSVGAEAGETINFKLTSNVPEDLINYLKPDPVDPPEITTRALPNSGEYILTFHDVMNKNLENPGNFKVVLDREGTEKDVELNNGQYILKTSNLEDSCTFEIELDLAALYEAGVITDEDIAKSTPIVVTYTATLNKDVVTGTYPNTAWVTYEGGETEEDTVNVKTYAIKIFKYDQADESKGLSGAEFTLKGPNGETYTATSGNDGYAYFNGLDDGEYTLQETKAPDGYVKSDTELPITIDTDTSTDAPISVKFANSLIPHTGGMGTTLFSIVGGALIVTAGVVFFVSRRKKSHTA